MMRKAIFGLLFLTWQVDASDYFTDYIKSIGFTDYSHYEQNKKFCFSLYDSKVTSFRPSSQCGIDMQCIQKETKVFMASQRELTSSREWLDYGCNKIMQLEASINENSNTGCTKESGEVVKEDVCGVGNAIIETESGWYTAAEHYSGVYLYEGDKVCGNLTTYGFEELCRDNKCGRFYIEDYESSIDAAYKELCD